MIEGSELHFNMQNLEPQRTQRNTEEVTRIRKPFTRGQRNRTLRLYKENARSHETADYTENA